MSNTNKIATYFRINRAEKTAIIYVKPNDKKAAQEFFCRLYAIENRYEVLSVIYNIEEIDYCDVLLIANPHVLSRNEIEYYGIVNDLKDNGIEVEIVINGNNAKRYIELINKEFKREKAR